MGNPLIDATIVTIFARESLEGGIIIGEYRTIILRNDWQNQPITQKEALRAMTVSAIAAASLALVVCVTVAIPLAVLSRDFDPKTADLIEGISKVVASVCILQLSLKMPKFFGIYPSRKNSTKDLQTTSVDDANDEEGHTEDENGEEGTNHKLSNGLSLKSIRFNVAWNIWREVAECGAFLIPFFLTGNGARRIPLSGAVGLVIGMAGCSGVYYANQKFKSTVGLTTFISSLLLLFSAGLFTGGCHEFEVVYGYTPVVWRIRGEFWNAEKLPMTLLQPFGYSSTRTVLQLACFWSWLLAGIALHLRKYYQFVGYRREQNEDINALDPSSGLSSTKPHEETQSGTEEEPNSTGLPEP